MNPIIIQIDIEQRGILANVADFAPRNAADEQKQSVALLRERQKRMVESELCRQNRGGLNAVVGELRGQYNRYGVLL